VSLCVAGAAFGEVQVLLFVAGASFGDVQVSLFVAGAVFGEVQVSLFVAGAVFGEIWNDSRSAKCCNFQYKMLVVVVKSTQIFQSTLVLFDPKKIEVFFSKKLEVFSLKK